MLFPTLDFAVFFFVIFLASWALLDRLELRKALLLGASYFFYGCWDWRFTSLLAASSALNYAIGLMIAGAEDPLRRKRWMQAGIAANLGVLAFFKYYGFFLDQMSELLHATGLERDLPFMEIILPVGISFFTFQGISYVVDIYRKDIEALRKPLDLFLYISFFPQLVAGPIVRASHFLPQLDRRPSLDTKTVAFGFVMILVGLFKKSVVANYIASGLVDEVFYDPASYSSIDLLVACYGYAVQVYCDFSAYSDIAIGVAALLGYQFRANFDRPLGATSLQALWQRWHISLSSFLRDYLYRWLRGKRGGGKYRIYRNTFLTMLIGGLWHGAAWTFIIWGAIHGSMLVVERIFKGDVRPHLERWGNRLSQLARSTIIPPVARGASEAATALGTLLCATGRQLANAADAGGRRLSHLIGRPLPALHVIGSAARVIRFPAIARPSLRLPNITGYSVGGWLFTFNVFALSAIFFRAQDMTVVSDYFSGLAALSGGIELTTPFLFSLIAGSIAIQFAPGNLTTRAAARLEAMPAAALGIVLGFGLLLIESLSPPGVAPFIYFQF